MFFFQAWKNARGGNPHSFIHTLWVAHGYSVTVGTVVNIGESKKSWASTETPPIDSHCLALPFGLVEKVNGYESIWMAIWIYMDVCLYVCVDQMALQQWGHKWTQWCNGLQMFTDVYRMLGCTARLQTTHPSANSFNIQEPSSPHLICSIKIQSVSVSLVHLLTLK